MSEQRGIFIRSMVVFLLIALGFVAVLWKAVYLQQAHGRHYRELSERMSLDTRTIDAQRGNLYAHDGSLLATTVTRYNLRFDATTPGLTEQIIRDKADSLAAGLARVLGGTAETYRQLLHDAWQQQRPDVLMGRQVDYLQLQQVRALPIINLANHRKAPIYHGGLVVESITYRERPMGRLAARTVGYYKPGSEQKAVGLEASMDSVLAGVPGQSQMRRIAGGMWIPVDGMPLVPPKNGRDVITTLDMELQDVADAALCQALHDFRGSHGTVVVMEVGTGNLRAMVNLMRTAGDGGCDESINYAVTESQDPGSTFKLISMLVALEDAGVSPATRIDLNGGQWNFSDEVMSDSRQHGIREADLTEIFARSSNVGISRLIQQHYGTNPGRFIRRLEEIGVMRPTGIPLAPEGAARMPRPGTKEWSNSTLPWLSIGYGLNLTPLQVLCLYNTVANRGKRVTPRLVEEIRGEQPQQTVITPIKQIQKPIASDKTLNELNKMLRAVVEKQGVGTGNSMYNPAYTVAAKTGTAKLNEGSGYIDRYRSSVVGFMPADRPRYSMVVMLSDLGDTAYYGGVVAGAVFRKVADHLYARGWLNSTNVPLALRDTSSPSQSHPITLPPLSGLEVPTRRAMEQLNIPYSPAGANVNTREHANPARAEGQAAHPTRVTTGRASGQKVDNPSVKADGSRWVQTRAVPGTWKLTEMTARKGEVADLTGMGLRDALQVADYLGYPTQIHGRGRVVRQQPAPGTLQTSGKILTLYLE